MSVLHNHQHCISQALATADQICQDKNIRLTPIRRRILELIWSQHKAIGAYDLLKEIQLEMPHAKAVTIYRGLDFLLKAKLIHKVNSLNAFIGCALAEKNHPSILFICDSCQNTKEISAQTIDQSLIVLCEQQQFHSQQWILELHGYCKICYDVKT